MGGGRYEPYGVKVSRRREAPLHSLKLTQRRTHPAVVYSTPAGERQRPRVRRGHEEKTRGAGELIPTRRPINETVFQILDAPPNSVQLACDSSRFRNRDFGHT